MKKGAKKKLLIISGLILVVLVVYFLFLKTTTTEPETLAQSIITRLKQKTPSPSPIPIPEEEVVNGFGEINENGTHTEFDMRIPVKGGRVTGTLTGFCEGTLEGSFDPRTDFVQGNMEGSCSKLSATGRFEGEIDLIERIGSGTYEGKAFVFTRSGFWDLTVE